MFSKITSFCLCGLEAYPIVIETFISSGLPQVNIVGLPDNAVRESKERVRAAIKRSGYHFPDDRITVNLSPADIKKAGPSFDLPIALGILCASGQIPQAVLDHYAFVGELSLEGNLQAISGSLSIALAAPLTFAGLILPLANAKEAALAERIPIFGLTHLSGVIHFLTDEQALAPTVSSALDLLKSRAYPFDFRDVKGQLSVKRALEIAAAGGHNVIMIGPPGSGKTMLAKRLATILPEMTLAEALQTAQIHSAAGNTRREINLIGQRPFRNPHHTCSAIALIGGGPLAKPGEVSLAHNGILFLDELPEFNRNVLEVLRQPLEDGDVTVARAKHTYTYPSQFMFIASMNPCPCGWLGDSRRPCRCSQLEILNYQHKISGPLLDRIDIHTHVPALKPNDIWNTAEGESSKTIKERTLRARAIQIKRFNNKGIVCNARMGHSLLKEICALDAEGKNLLINAMDHLKLSARAHDKILKVARTIADLAAEENILPSHIAEAIQYRSLDRN